MPFYHPAEDSYFLAEIIKKEIKNKNIKCLDIGTGSGIQSKTLIELGIKKQNITAIDINKDALAEAKKLKIKTINSNLFQNIKEKYDLIIFNPPYLSESEFDNESDTTGGKQGDEVIIEFIKQLKKHLTKKGKAFLLTSSLTPNKEWQKLAEKNNLKIKKLATKKIFYEELYVWEINPTLSPQ
jgi:release factor glutamine methyltransferase